MMWLVLIVFGVVFFGIATRGGLVGIGTRSPTHALERDGFDVQVFEDSEGSDVFTRVDVAGDGLPTGLQFEAARYTFFGAPAPRSFGTGDVSFDDVVFTRTERPTAALGALPRAARDAVRAAVGIGATFSAGRWTVGDAQPTEAWLKLAPVMHAARQLADAHAGATRGLLDALLMAVRDDPSSGYRRQCLIAALEIAEDVDAVIAAGLADPDDGVRLVAARQLGIEGIDTLGFIACRPGLHPARVEAVEALRSLGEADDACHAVLEAGPSSVSPGLGLAVMGWLDDVEPVPETLFGWSAHPDPDVRIHVARHLGRMGPGASPALLALFDGTDATLLSGGDTDVAVAAIDALGASATPDAVPMLYARSPSGLAGRAVRKAIERAASRIKARHADRGGRLALSDGDGRLSHIDGRVSTIDDPPEPTDPS